MIVNIKIFDFILFSLITHVILFYRDTSNCTQRGTDVFINDGFDYTLRKDRVGANGEKTWRCRQYKKFKCSAYLRTLNDEVIGGNHTHSHPQVSVLNAKKKEEQSVQV